MSDFVNPYQSPESPAVPDPQSSGLCLSGTMLQYLKETAPWLRFLGILGFISCGLIFFGGLILTIASLAVSGLMDNFGELPVWSISLIYVPLGVLSYFPSRFMYNFGTKIRDYQLNNSPEDLEIALKNNKSLWKYFGILTIIYLALVPFSVAIAIVGGIITAITGLSL